MKSIIRELRRREVFRTAGLYVGICWIVIEVGSVLLPVFDAPEWLFRGMIIAAVAGFPVMLILAWFFDVNEGGISLQGDVQDTAPEKMGARKSDFAIIGFLGVALVVSLYLNVSDESPNDTVLEPVAVLISMVCMAACTTSFPDWRSGRGADCRHRSSTACDCYSKALQLRV